MNLMNGFGVMVDYGYARVFTLLSVVIVPHPCGEASSRVYIIVLLYLCGLSCAVTFDHCKCRYYKAFNAVFIR